MRIVSLLSSATEILFGIGAGEDVVAISHECDYPSQATKLPRATRSLVDSSQPSEKIDAQVKRLMEAGEALYEIDRKLMSDLAPNLIVTQAQCDVCAVRYQDVVDFVAQTPSLARTNVVALNPQSLVDILTDMLRVGAAAGALAAARRYAESLDERIRRVAAATGATWKGWGDTEVGSSCREGPGQRGVSNRGSALPAVSSHLLRQVPPGRRNLPPVAAAPTARPRVVCLEWLAPLMTAGNWTPELIELAGGESCLAVGGQHSGYVEWNAVRDCNPDVLLVAPCGFGLARSTAEACRLWDLPGFGELTAIQRGRAFVIDGNAYLNRSGPRIVDSLEILAHLIRPDLFQPTTSELAAGRAWAMITSTRPGVSSRT